MTGLGVFALVSVFVLLLGMLSFAMMFQDITPSQNSYWWPFMIPLGAAMLLLCGIAWLVQVLA